MALFEDYLVNFDNCADVPSETCVQEELLNEQIWNNLILTRFDDDNLSEFFENLTEDRLEEYFRFGVNCVNVFVQENFTGPQVSSTFETFFVCDSFESVDFKKWLAVDEELNVNAKLAPLLVAALCIFRHCKWNRTLNLWWQLRGLILHQHVLDELSPRVLHNANELRGQLEELDLTPRLRVLLEIEQAHLHQTFRNVSKSEKHLSKARELLGLRHELAGALGKRTKYQASDIPQLRLSVEVAECTPVSDVVLQLPVPKNLVLEDDVRLDTVQFTNDLNLPPIPDLHQKYLVAYIRHLQISQPRDNLYYEEIKPYLDYILGQNNTWVVRVVVLLMRCKLESSHKRTIERCLLQCEDVVNHVKKHEPNALNRLGGVYSTNFPPVWQAEAQLADLMLNTGLVKASLEIYLRLELWEEVIVCYTLLKLRHKAAEVIRQRLDVAPTVKLWCLLGDATDDVACYETAWKLSDERSSRAQRHWGEYFYYRKNYAESIPHLEKSLSINPLQANVWLRYGFAALELEDWQTAATAYKRYTMLEPGNFQAWNNLAKAYVKLGNKHAAHQALHDAIKFNFDSWKVWDNLMAVSVDTKNYSDVINAYQRILDLKEKHLDLEVLQALVAHVVTGSEDQQLKRTRELLGRLTSIYPLEGYLWELYAELSVDHITRIQRLQRAYRGLTREGWEKSLEKCREALFVCCKLSELVLKDEIKATEPLIQNVRLNLTACVAAIKRQSYEEPPQELEEVSSLLQKIIEKCKLGTNNA